MDISFINLCACMGPQGGDPFCPCQMGKMGMNGYYNCNGDKEALSKREHESHERLRAALKKLSNHSEK